MNGTSERAGELIRATPDVNGRIRVGITEKHGMALEFSQNPANGVEYSFLRPMPSGFRMLRSPIKGFLNRYESDEHDVIESLMSPIYTSKPWIYSCAKFHEALAFNCLGAPLPRTLRVAYMKRLILSDNCARVVFWSHAGLQTLATYAGIRDDRLLRKTTVVYPAVRRVDDERIASDDGQVNLLFSGDFFKKGGINVIDAFERIQNRYPGVHLNLCCDPATEFNSSSPSLKAEYVDRIQQIPNVNWLGRISRDRLIDEILPRTSAYLLPTYCDAFGFAILEAMAFGIPVIATNFFAIPEILEHNVSGLLIDTSRFDCERMFRGQVIDPIPTAFRETVTEQLFGYLCQIIESADLRRRLGAAALRTARTKFSFETRNSRMLPIYQEAVDRRHGRRG